MANHGRRPRRGGASTPVRRNKAAPADRHPKPKPPKKTRPTVYDTPPEEPRTFRLGVVPGATPGRWIDAWKQRMPRVPLALVPITVANEREELAEVDAAIVRLPLDDESLHVIPLYDEIAVVVASADSHLMAAEELAASDLVGEVVIVPEDDVFGPLDLPGTVAPSFPPLPTTEDAIAAVATGVGIIIVPMSLARLHHRKDVDYRPIPDAPTSTVALAWPRERTTADVETFVGIVRGRTQNSSR